MGWRPPRTTTQPCAHQRAELVFLVVWIAITAYADIACRLWLIENRLILLDFFLYDYYNELSIIEGYFPD